MAQRSQVACSSAAFSCGLEVRRIISDQEKNLQDAVARHVHSSCLARTPKLGLEQCPDFMLGLEQCLLHLLGLEQCPDFVLYAWAGTVPASICLGWNSDRSLLFGL